MVVQHGYHFWILLEQQGFLLFDQNYLAAEVSEYLGKLHPNRSAAYNQHSVGQTFEFQRPFTGDHAW
jgi:hypothetical protein